MIPVISPDVFRDYSPRSRLCRWTVSAALYGGAALVSSGLVGWIAGGIGLALGIAQMVAAPILLAAAAALYGMHELGIVKMPHPQLRRQAPSGWRNLHPWVTAAAFGGYLGLGLLHFTFTTTFLVALLWCLATANPPQTGAAMMAFGLGQAIPIILASRRVTSPDRAYEIGLEIDAWAPGVRIFNGVAMIAVAVLVALAGWRA